MSNDEISIREALGIVNDLCRQAKLDEDNGPDRSKEWHRAQRRAFEMAAEIIRRVRENESIVTHRSEDQRKDSVEIGTAGKGGALKVYFDAGCDAEEAKRRVDIAKAALDHARKVMGVE